MRMEPRRLLRQSLPEILPSWCNVGCGGVGVGSDLRVKVHLTSAGGGRPGRLPQGNLPISSCPHLGSLSLVHQPAHQSYCPAQNHPKAAVRTCLEGPRFHTQWADTSREEMGC